MSKWLEKVDTKETIDVSAVVQQRGVELDGTEGITFWPIPAELLKSPGGLAMRAEALCPPTTVSWPLERRVMGESEEAEHLTHCQPMNREPRGKGNCYFFDNVGTAGPWTEAKWNRRFSTRPSFGGRSDAVLAVSWERADCHISGLPAVARGSTCRPRYRFSVGWSSSGGCRRVLMEDWGLACGVVVAGGASRDKMFWFCTAENCWAKPSTVSPNCRVWEMGASRKHALSTSFISTRLSQTWRSWTTRVDIIFLRDLAVVFRHPEGEVSHRTQLLHQPRVRTTLKSIQVTIICIALLTVQILSKQLYISLILSWVALHQLYSILTGK